MVERHPLRGRGDTRRHAQRHGAASVALWIGLSAAARAARLIGRHAQRERGARWRLGFGLSVRVRASRHPACHAQRRGAARWRLGFWLPVAGRASWRLAASRPATRGGVVALGIRAHGVMVGAPNNALPPQTVAALGAWAPDDGAGRLGGHRHHDRRPGAASVTLGIWALGGGVHRGPDHQRLATAASVLSVPARPLSRWSQPPVNAGSLRREHPT